MELEMEPMLNGETQKTKRKPQFEVCVLLLAMAAAWLLFVTLNGWYGI